MGLALLAQQDEGRVSGSLAPDTNPPNPIMYSVRKTATQLRSMELGSTILSLCQGDEGFQQVRPSVWRAYGVDKSSRRT
jgi:hypothetical protein